MIIDGVDLKIGDKVTVPVAKYNLNLWRKFLILLRTKKYEDYMSGYEEKSYTVIATSSAD